MTDTKCTTPTPDSATPTAALLLSGAVGAGDPDEYYEDSEYAAREQLGLRKTHFPRNADASKGLHPDDRPCPPWCWVGQHPEYGHEIDPEFPLSATHTAEVRLAVLATKYRGSKHPSGRVEPATIETTLEQIGQGAPTISVFLRRVTGFGAAATHHYDNRLRLSVNDARELVQVLSLYVAAAEPEVDDERNAFEIGVDAGAAGLVRPSDALLAERDDLREAWAHE